jgi:hypothetical protein
MHRKIASQMFALTGPLNVGPTPIVIRNGRSFHSGAANRRYSVSLIRKGVIGLGSGARLPRQTVVLASIPCPWIKRVDHVFQLRS